MTLMCSVCVSDNMVLRLQVHGFFVCSELCLEKLLNSVFPQVRDLFEQVLRRSEDMVGIQLDHG